MANDEIISNQSLSTRWGDKVQQVSQQITSLLDDGKKKNTITVLDGIRGFACFIVVFYHLHVLARDYHTWIPIHDLGSLVGSILLFGESGVILFFILSGFLLFLPYAKSLLFEKDWPSLRLFYLRRAFRIVPAYYVALFLLIITSHREYLQKSHWENLWLFITFRMDFPQTYQQISGPFWTMAIEVQFYVMLPLLAWVMSFIVCRGSRRRRVTWLTICVCGIIAWGLLSRYWGLYISNTPALNFLISPSLAATIKPYIYGSDGKYFESFGIGMLICVAYVYSQNTAPDTRWNTGMCRISPILFIAGIIILFFMCLWHFYMWYFNWALRFMDPYRDILVQGWDQWQAICFAVAYGLFMCALLYEPKRLRRLWEWIPLRWIGLLSYSLYIWHVPLMLVFLQYILPHLQAAGLRRLLQYGIFWLWTLLIIVPFSLLSYLLVEKPGMRLGEIVCRKLLKREKKQSIVPQQDRTPALERPLETAVSSRRDV